MAQAQTRAEFQALALLRLKEAKALLDLGAHEGAYYLTGYVVEYGLKACVARRRMRNGSFPDRRFSTQVYTHDLDRLIALANLDAERRQWSAAQPKFQARWAVVSQWTPEARYETRINANAAADLYQAVSAPQLGVLKWLKKHW